MTTPFSYHLYHIPTKLHYYGVRYKKGCKIDDLWTIYFTSSKIVKQLVNEYGKESFVYTIRKTFVNGKEALLWEHRVLRRLNAANRDDWINRHNGGKKFRGPESHSERTKNHLRNKITGIKRNQTTIEKHRKNAATREKNKRDTGWKMSDKGKENIAIAMAKPEVKQKIYTAERNKKMAASKTGKRRFYLPDGSFIMITPQDDQ